MEIDLGEGRGRGAGVKGFRAIDRSARTSSRRREPNHGSRADGDDERVGVSKPWLLCFEALLRYDE
jgi:hypothetical protein